MHFDHLLDVLFLLGKALFVYVAEQDLEQNFGLEVLAPQFRQTLDTLNSYGNPEPSLNGMINKFILI